MKKISEINFKNKRVLVRCDFNVPVSDKGEVLDDFRIRQAVPTIKRLVGEGARIVLMSHLEKKGKLFSLDSVALKLGSLLGQKVKVLKNYIEKDKRAEIEKLEPGQVVLLENLRFYRQEKENDGKFAKRIASLGDVFVNEAFSVSHRKHASVVSVPEHLPGTIGLLFEKELEAFSRLLNNVKRDFVVVMGGVKIHTKIDFILGIMKKADHLLFSSKLTESVLVHQGILKNRDLAREETIGEINSHDEKICLAPDGVMASDKGEVRIGKVESLKKNEDVFDVGPETISEFSELIKKAGTVLFNGPMGMYEDKRFEKGTREVLSAVAGNKSAFKVAGGGDTVLAVNKFGFSRDFDFLSTGGGAMLKYLADESLPGLEALNHGN